MRIDLRRTPTVLRIAAIPAVAVAVLALRFAAADALPEGMLWLVDLGVAGLALGAVVQSFFLLMRVQRSTERGLATMEGALLEMRADLDAQRRATEHALAASAEGPDRAAIDEVASEVRVLHALVAGLSARGTTGGASAPAAAAAAAAAVRAGAVPGSQVQRRAVGGKESPRASLLLDEPEILSIVRSGLREGRVDVYVQPIVSLPQRRHRFYECFSRIRDADGNVVGPDRYLGGAEREGLIGAIDNMLLFRSVQLVRRIHKANREVGIFVNISEHSLADKRFFRDFAAFVAENKELAPYLIFEFAQAHVARHGAAVMLELERLARRGFRFSMDQVTDLDLDIDALAERQFRFIKVDARRLLQAARDEAAPLDLRRFKASLDRNQIDLVVERIEDEQALLELLDYPIDFGQGYLFGEPRLAKTAA
jgi:cyclic-di-GMP phosphodiesterase TipF (flagellum assembly factor)